MIVYLDASALVKRYVDELASDQVRELLSERPVVATALITRVEVAAAILKAVRTGRVSDQEADWALEAFRKDWHDIARISLTDVVAEEAVQLARKHHLRSYDAVHLASVVLLLSDGESSEPVTVATFDKELWQSAIAEGLTAWPKKLE